MPFGAELAADGGDALPALGAGRAHASSVLIGRRGAARARRADAAAAPTAGTRPRVADARGRHALPLPRRRRPRGARSGLALQPRRRARRRARWSTRAPSSGATTAGAAGRGTRRWSTSCTSAPSRPRARFAAAARELPTTWRELGVTAIELMPLADFPGRRNWGYDGVLPFAPDAALRHARGAEGASSTPRTRAASWCCSTSSTTTSAPKATTCTPTAPQFFNPAHQTPWGAAINFDGERQRARCATSSSTTRSTGSRSSASTACAWTRCTRSATTRRRHIVDEICARAARRPGPRAPRPPGARERRATRRAGWRATRDGRPAGATAQWNDDLHHAAHVLLTGETRRLLRRLRATRRVGSFGARWPKASSTRASRRAFRERRAARRAERAPAAERLRRPSCRTTTRSATARSASASTRSPTRRALRAALRLPAAGAARADAVHGRGVRGDARRSSTSATSSAELAAAVREGRRDEFAPLRGASPTRPRARASPIRTPPRPSPPAELRLGRAPRSRRTRERLALHRRAARAAPASTWCRAWPRPRAAAAPRCEGRRARRRLAAGRRRAAWRLLRELRRRRRRAAGSAAAAARTVLRHRRADRRRLRRAWHRAASASRSRTPHG